MRSYWGGVISFMNVDYTNTPVGRFYPDRRFLLEDSDAYAAAIAEEALGTRLHMV